MSNPKADTFAEVRQFIRTQLVETGVPSVAVAVAQNGEILWEEGFGWAVREDRTPATPHTLYSLASISKPITATGLMVLKARGLIDLDRPANDYLGNAALTARIGSVADATVRRVANHSSGLPLHCHFFYADESCDPPPRDETIRRYGALVTPPGERYQYANIGYGILDHLITRLSGKPYADFMREEIFIPLNLPRMSVNIAPGLEKYQAARYAPNGLPLPFYTFDHPGASAVWASAHDLVRFGMFHLKAHLPDQRPVLSDTAIDEMQVPTVETGDHAGYGIGWRVVSDDNGYKTVGHDGSMGGVRTRLLLVPSENLAVVVLANAQTDLPIRMTAEILSVLLPGYAEARAQKDAERAKADRPAEPAFRSPSHLLATWAGTVHTDNGEIPFSLQFQEDGDIHARLGNQLETLINTSRFNNNILTGRLCGSIGTEDAAKHPYHLQVNLTLRGDALNGVLTVISTPSGRSGNALSHWTELNRQSDSSHA